MDRKKLLKTLIVLIFLIFIVNFLANKFYLYSSVWYFDMIMHALGGFWVGLFFTYLSPQVNNRLSLLYIIKVLVFVILIGFAWEIYEALVNDVVAQNAFNYLDTISDIFFDLAGGIISILYFFKQSFIAKKDDVHSRAEF